MDEIRPDRNDDRDARPDRGEPAGVGIPRWVKAFITVGVVLVVLVAVALLAGHGPGRHLRHGAGAHAEIGVSGGAR